MGDEWVGPAFLSPAFPVFWRSALSSTKSDINEHCDKRRELAAQAQSVVEFRMPHGVWTVALLPGSAWNVHGVFVAYQSSTKGRMSVLCSLPPQDDVNTGKDCSHVFVGESTHKFRQYGFVDRDNQ